MVASDIEISLDLGLIDVPVNATKPPWLEGSIVYLLRPLLALLTSF